MKKLILGIMLFLTTLVSPVVSFAANSAPITLTGESVKYNTPYYLKDRYQNFGGASFWPYLNHDYVYFHTDKTALGTPIVFEASDKRNGDIRVGDKVAVRSTLSNWPHWFYWTNWGPEGVYFSDKPAYVHEVYSDSYSRTSGIGLIFDYWGKGWPIWSEYYIHSNTWMYAAEAPNGKNDLHERSTPFILIKAN